MAYPPGPQDQPWTPADDEARKRARKRVQAKRDLGTHAVAYFVVNLFLIGVWAFTDQTYFWPAWVLGGWGIGLALNAWEVLGRRPITDADIERELRRGDR